VARPGRTHLVGALVRARALIRADKSMAVSGLLLCALLAAAPAATEGAPPEADGDEAARDSPDKLGGVNPARLIPRLELRQRFTRLPGGQLHTTTVRMDVVLFRRALLRYELPMPVQRTAAGTQSGIGDIALTLIGLVSSGPRHAVVAIGGVTLDSASRAALGAGKQQVTFGGAAGYKATPWWLAYAIVGQQLSFAGDPARPPVRRLLLELGNAVFGGRGDWYLLDLDVPIDFQADTANLLGALETGHLLVGRVGLFVRGGTQLLGPRQVEYFVDAGVRYLFKLR